MSKADDRDQEHFEKEQEEAEPEGGSGADDKINDPLTRSDEEAPQKPFQPPDPT